MKKSLILSFLVILASLMLNSEAKAELPFRDITESSPIYDELIYLDERGILGGGYSYIWYSPEQPAERRQAVTMIALALGLDEAKRNTIFSDISKDHHASGLIQSAVDKGIVTGYGDGTFKPYNNLTRGNFSLFIDRAFGEYLPSGTNIEFKDVPKTLNSYNAIKKLSAAGITTGYGDKTFRPNETLTRAHLAIFMYRTVKYLEDRGVVFKDSSNSDYKDSDIKWGMSYDSVYELVKNNITTSTRNARIITNKARYALTGETYYLFDKNNRLDYFWHEFDWSKEENLPDTLPLLHKMYEEKVIEEFGVPFLTNKVSNSSYLSYYSAWDMGAYYVTLETTKKAEGEVTVKVTVFDSRKEL
ncbi:S-layer homology domain-containing protein [Lysinibacillus sp. FSL W8-0992]|uniref:S-layer homology domain-containing protein n=1 Tax=Lysinibacillus sp. FSL W8-0992 TaxID=2954643 RepID=UPI0030FAC800